MSINIQSLSELSSEREWYYIDGNGVQKGPLPATILVKLLEKGVGVSSNTLVWKNGLISWVAACTIYPFQSICEFQQTQWYFIDNDGEQKGPVLSRMIMHKLKEGEIDGLTLVFSHTHGKEWNKLADIPVLKEAIRKITLEEEIANSLIQADVERDLNEQEQKKVFVFNVEDSSTNSMNYSDLVPGSLYL